MGLRGCGDTSATRKSAIRGISDRAGSSLPATAYALVRDAHLLDIRHPESTSDPFNRRESRTPKVKRTFGQAPRTTRCTEISYERQPKQPKRT